MEKEAAEVCGLGECSKYSREDLYIIGTLPVLMHVLVRQLL